MFGHQDDQHHHHDDDNKPMGDVLSDDVVDQVASTEHHDGAVVSGDGGNASDSSDDSGGFNPALPTDNGFTNDAPAADMPADDGLATPVVGHDSPAAAPGNEDLLGIKQQVLTSLSPLVDHLDQTPEEKFRTTMMMIQASDNQDLIKAAYEAAQNIPDEKVKAQALLDIVNEINYFTQQAS